MEIVGLRMPMLEWSRRRAEREAYIAYFVLNSTVRHYARIRILLTASQHAPGLSQVHLRRAALVKHFLWLIIAAFFVVSGRPTIQLAAPIPDYRAR